MLEIGCGADLGLDILQVGKGLVDDLQLPVGQRRRLGRGADHCHLLLLEDTEGLGRVAARGARSRGAAGVAGRCAGCDGRARGGGTASDRPGPGGVCALIEEEEEHQLKGQGCLFILYKSLQQLSYCSVLSQAVTLYSATPTKHTPQTD